MVSRHTGPGVTILLSEIPGACRSKHSYAYGFGGQLLPHLLKRWALPQLCPWGEEVGVRALVLAFGPALLPFPALGGAVVLPRGSWLSPGPWEVAAGGRRTQLGLYAHPSSLAPFLHYLPLASARGSYQSSHDPRETILSGGRDGGPWKGDLASQKTPVLEMLAPGNTHL